jgi:hypothetical protein
MGIDIGIKTNILLTKDRFSQKQFEFFNNEQDTFHFFTDRSFGHLIMNGFEDPEFEFGETYLGILNQILQTDNSFLLEPKPHWEEEEMEAEAPFAEGWVNSSYFFENLRKLKIKLLENPDFNTKMVCEEKDLQVYFGKTFLNDIENFIQFLEIANQNGVTEITYSFG